MRGYYCWEDVLDERDRMVFDVTSRKPRELGERPALLLIDLYHKAFGDRPEPIETAMQHMRTSCGIDAWNALPALRKLLAACRDAGIPIAHSTGEDRVESHLDQSRRLATSSTGDLGDDYAFVDAVAPLPGEFVVRKSRPSALFGTVLDSWLRSHRVDTLIVAGESTSGCVRATVVDAFSLNLKVVVCQDAVFDRSILSHKINLLDMHTKYASVLNVEDVLPYVEATSREGWIASNPDA